MIIRENKGNISYGRPVHKLHASQFANDNLLKFKTKPTRFKQVHRTIELEFHCIDSITRLIQVNN